MTEIPSFLITFRETLEAALVVGIVLAFLFKTKQSKYNRTVYAGVLAGIAASVVVALLFILLAGSFEGAAAEIFEGVTMLFGAALITTLIIWMLKQANVSKSLEEGARKGIDKTGETGLFLLVFTAVLREGSETVIFLGAASFAGAYSLIGAVAGIIVSIAFSYLLFLGLLRISLKKVFTATSVLLILFAAGLVAHGIHELEEARVLPDTGKAWDINPPKNSDGTYPLLHDKGDIGEIAKGLFGYNGDPSKLEAFAYSHYLIMISLAYYRMDKKRAKKDGKKDRRKG